TPLDVSFLYLEEATTPMHVGSVGLFQPPEGGFDLETLCRLISRRIAFVPRYRQRLRWVPGRIANPVWVDDERFDINYHIRRSSRAGWSSSPARSPTRSGAPRRRSTRCATAWTTPAASAPGSSAPPAACWPPPAAPRALRRRARSTP